MHRRTVVRKKRTLPKYAACVGAIVVMLALPRIGQAQQNAQDKVAAAQALYDDAVAAMDAKDYPQACMKLEEAVRLVPEGIGAKLTLAECYEAMNKLASAWSQYAIAKSMAERAGQTQRAARAEAKAIALAGQLAKLTIDVPASVRAIPNLTITRRGVPVGEAQWGAAVPVDVGGHEIVVTAPGYKKWTRQVTVANNGDKIVIEVAAPAIEERKKVDELDGVGPTLIVRDIAAERPWQKPLGFAIMGVGAAGLALGGVLGGLAIQKNNAANDGLCDANDFCNREGLSLRSDAVKLGNGSTAALAVGGAVLLGGVIIVATSPGKGREQKGLPPGIAANIEWTAGGVRVRGTF